jgi:hypothetical protein
MFKCRKKGDPASPEVAMGATYTEVARRLANFRPGVQLADHVQCFFEEHDSILDGFTFRAKNADLLIGKLRHCQNAGEKAFAEAKMESQKNPGMMEKHFPIEASFLSTHGTGFREIWRGPVLSDRPLSTSANDDLSSRLSNDALLPDITSLHCAIAANVCNIHVDQMGFVIEGEDGEIIVDPDAFEHIFNELWWKTNAKEAAPGWMGGAFDRLSWIYPNSRNHYARMGPRIDQVPLLRDIDRLPGIGKIVGKIPLPGLSFDLVREKRYKVTLNATCGVHGDCTATVDVSGDW